jgi:ATP-binding cassette, subfamily F, member 3
MLHASHLTYRLGGRLLLNEASFAIAEGSHVGFLGRNGTGKTTLFRILRGEIEAESGSFGLPQRARLGSVAQEAPSGETSLIDTVLAADSERSRLLAEAHHADGFERAQIETRLVDIDAYSAPARAAAILNGLGFNSQAQQRPCASFSGGWRMRVALASVLFTRPDCLLLDEPTNYLDLEGTLWLYDYLKNYPHTVLVISHDRELLETCVDHILHLDNGKLTVWRGNYSSFLRQKAQQNTLLGKAQARQQEERRKIEAFVERFRAKASKAKQAQSRLKRLEKLEPVVTLHEADVLRFSLPAPEKPLAAPLLVLENASTGYNEIPVLQKLTLSLLPDDRIALLGPNGNGKSTFCKLLAGRLPLLGGIRKASSRLDVAFFAQHQSEALNLEKSAYEHIRALMPDVPEAKIRTRAAQMGFSGPRADTKAAALSGGEKARLHLGLIAFHGPHLLIFDEPTNHLDIDSREALAEAINAYPGAVILVSHDRSLIDSCAERLWIVSDGTVCPFEGDLEDYRESVISGKKQQNIKRQDTSTLPPLSSRLETRRLAAEQRDREKPLRQKREALEKRMEALISAITKIDTALADGQAFLTHSVKATDLSRKRAEAAATLVALEEEWLRISEEVESFTRQGKALS